MLAEEKKLQKEAESKIKENIQAEQNLAVRIDDSANSSSCQWMEPPTNTNLRLLTHAAIF